MQSWLKRGVFSTFALLYAAFALVGMTGEAQAFGSVNKFVVIDNEDAAATFTGAWTVKGHADVANVTPVVYGESYLYVSGSGSATESATSTWNFGNIAFATGSYSFDAFIPDSLNYSGSAVEYRLQSAPWSLFGGCGTTYANTGDVWTTNADLYEGRWMPIGSATLSGGTCYQLVLSNKNNSGAVLVADAVRAERLFESSFTVVDMPRIATAFAVATTAIPSSSNAVPTIITTLSVTCPADGSVLVTGSGESAAQTNVAGTNFNGLAYSISKNSTATDNNNVVQSSALATFNGDANRDFLNIQRVDSCASGEAITYRLTAYRSQAATGPASFVWNGRLVAQYFATGF